MNTEGDSTFLRLENEKLRNENDYLKIMNELLKENADLKFKLQTSISDSTLVGTPGRQTTIQWQDSMNESRFKHDLNQTSKHPHKTSSPINLQSFTRSCMNTNRKQHEETTSCSYMSHDIKETERVLGEIAFQLDRRILSYVFQGHTRLYGFTVINIQDKIVEVSTHPLTGKMDEGYRLLLSQRHADLMDRLSQLGYSTILHPPFTEFIVNTYGILQQRPKSSGTQGLGYNSTDFWRKVLINTTPSKLLKDLLLLLNCLSYMAGQDGRPLILW
ncbi:hypothetical protein UPYG_G00157160 [Umbra pygmaea]|uniref:Speriolin C-terminal domain-containing protein n=1 Tax=Umbra pygmaea TaxID=75934 RepID=A0ABD0X2X6_UMBPY